MNKNFFLYILYFAFAALLYSFLKYYVDSADTLQYITIAKNYSEGYFADAVNSFWSPLIAWLLIPFVFLHIEPVFAFKILQIIIGFFTLKIIFYHIEQTHAKKLIHSTLKAACVPLVLSFAFLFSTPDLLLLTLYLWFVKLLKNNSSPLLIGICGAAMYFTKGFGFAFFIVTFACAFLYKIFSGEIEKKKAAGYLLRGFGIFFLLCLPWVLLISWKEGKFLFSSAGTNALNMIDPKLNPNPFDDIHYDFEKGVLSEPPEHAISAWIYPHRLTESEWSPFNSTADFLHYLKMVLRNIISVGSFHFGKDDAGTALVIALILLFAIGKADLKNLLKQNAFLLIVCLTCTTLYSLLVTIHRYLWINDIAIIILFSIIVQKLFEWKRGMGYLFLAVFIFLLVYYPVKSITENINEGKGIYSVSQELKNKYDLRGNIVSLTDSSPDKNHRLSHLVAYYTGTWYYGMAAKHNAPELEKEKINFVLDWSPSANNWLKKNKLANEVVSFPNVGLTVYEIRRLTLRTD